MKAYSFTLTIIYSEVEFCLCFHHAESCAFSFHLGLCVGCLSEDGGTELLELSLPDRLTAGQKKEGLTPGRDFHFLSGGFHEEAICQIKHLPNTRYRPSRV